MLLSFMDKYKIAANANRRGLFCLKLPKYSKLLFLNVHKYISFLFNIVNNPSNKFLTLIAKTPLHKS